jgi:hypothetical protein
MHPANDWCIEYTKEIEHAFSALQAGNAGKARVCARRAAGIIIGEYLNRRGYPYPRDSAYGCLAIFISLPGVGKDYQDIANHFLLIVDRDHKLPEDIDLISDAQRLAENLLLENIH